MSVQKITPFLWFNNNAEEAALFYTALFPNSRINQITRYGENSPFPAGTAMSVSFELFGTPILALNGGPHYQLTPALSLFLRCDNQEEIDLFWDSLAVDGKPLQCGWITDKFGLTWQIVPGRIMDLLNNPDPEKAKKVMATMLAMQKIEIQPLIDAAK